MIGNCLNTDWAALSNTTASWVQAVGSVMAIVAAILVAGSQARREERQRAEKRAEVVLLGRELVTSGEKRLTALFNAAMEQETNLDVVNKIEVIGLTSAADALARLPIEQLLPAHNARAAVIAENRLRMAADILDRGGETIRAVEDTENQIRLIRELAAPLLTHLTAIWEVKCVMDAGVTQRGKQTLKKFPWDSWKP